MAEKLFHDQSPQKNVAGREDRTRDRPHTRQTRIRSNYCAMFNKLFVNSVHKLSSIYVFSYFLFGFEGRIWDLIVSVPDHCFSFYFSFETEAMGVLLI